MLASSYIRNHTLLRCMSTYFDGLYAQAGAVPTDFDDESLLQGRGITLSVGTSSSSCTCSDDDSDSGTGAHARHAHITVADTCRRLRRSLACADEVLAQLDHLVSQYTTDGVCTISGVSKFRGRVVTEGHNLKEALDSLARCETGEQETPPELSAAYLLARCNGIEHYAFVMQLAAVAQEVVGLFVSVSATGPGSARYPLEVDLVTCGGLRWVKARTSGVSSLRSGLDESVEPKYVSQVRELCYRAGHTLLPFGRHPEVCVLFKAVPPVALSESLRRYGAHVVTASTINTALLPPLEWKPRFVCLDTTTLVALCAFTAFPSAEDYSVEKQLLRLERYKVLSEQVRKEQVDPAVSKHIDGALSRLTTWTTRREATAAVEEEIATRLAVFNGCQAAASSAPLSSTMCNTRLRFPLTRHHVDDWIAALLPGDLTMADVGSSSTVREVDAERERRACAADVVDEDASIPNWIIADITLQEFRWMIETLAGPEEILRAAQVLRNVLVVDTTCLRTPAPGCHTVVTPLQRMKAGGRLLARNKVVFGMADAVSAVLLTSNRQVVNAAKERGLTLMVSLHPSRSLTEQKVKGLLRRSGPPKPPPFAYEETTIDSTRP